MTDEISFSQEAQLALELLQSNRTLEATHAFERLTVSWAGRVEAWNYLGYVYALQGRHNESAEALKRGLAITPSHTNTNTDLSVAYINLGRYEEAAEILIELSKHTSESDRGNAKKRLSYVLKKIKDRDFIKKVTPELVECFSNDSEIMDVCWKYVYQSAQNTDCIPALDAYLKTCPNDAYAREVMAYVMFVAGKFKQSGQEFETLLSTLRPLKDRAERFHKNYNEGIIATRMPPTSKRRKRFENLVYHLHDTLNLQGDIAECGMFRGLSSYLICKTVAAENPDYRGDDFYGFDSFEGLSEPTSHDLKDKHKKPNTKKGDFSASLEQVKANLSAFPNVTLLKGWIPERFSEVSDKEFRFVHVDVDLYQPSKDALEFFYPRLVSKGKIVCDDYNWPGQAEAVDEFCMAHKIKVEKSKTDQAILTKE